MTADTNVLVYLWDRSDPGKSQVSLLAVSHLLGRRDPMGLQVVGELQNVLRRKLRQPIVDAASRARDILTAFQVFAPSAANALESLTLMERGILGYWDALLVTAARDAGCRTLLSEDMQDGARFGALEIVNPFGLGGAPSARLQSLLTL